MSSCLRGAFLEEGANPLDGPRRPKAGRGRPVKTIADVLPGDWVLIGYGQEERRMRVSRRGTGGAWLMPSDGAAARDHEWHADDVPVEVCE